MNYKALVMFEEKFEEREEMRNNCKRQGGGKRKTNFDKIFISICVEF